MLERLQEVLAGNTTIERQAEHDSALTAELLLLFRMILADGEVRERELETLRRVCRDALGIDGGSLDLVHGYLEEHGNGITVPQAVKVFLDLSRERRIALARHAVEIARADDELNAHEARFLARMLDMLDLTPADLQP